MSVPCDTTGTSGGSGPVRARFVVVEGGEAAGKSTQAARLAGRLDAVLTREPGGTPVGAAVRTLLLDPDVVGLDDRTEALLMAADRAQHVVEVVRPALDAGRHVVSDRYVGSSLAYQGFGRGLPVDEVRRLSAWATGYLEPDVVVLLEVSPAVAASRLAGRPDRLEAAGDGFHRRVAAGYRALAAADPARWTVVGGDDDPDAVEAAVWAAVTERCPDLAQAPAAGGGGGAGATDGGAGGSAGAGGSGGQGRATGHAKMAR